MTQSIDVLEAGKGRPIVLVHGFGTPRDAFDDLTRDLSAERRVLVPAMPGYAPSAPLPAGSTLADGVGALEDALLARGVHEAAVVGYSLGAYRALVLALRARVRVTGLLLLGGFAWMTDAERAQYRELAPLAAQRALPPRIASQRLLSPSFAAARPDLADRVDAWFEAIARETIAGEASALAECEDLRSRLGSIDDPVCARAGTADVAVPPERSDEIARLVPRGSVARVEGAGHLLMLEDPAGTLAAARAL